MSDGRLENIFRPGPPHDFFSNIFFIDSERSHPHNSKTYPITHVAQIFSQQFKKV